ncbi:hypothetical protein OS493_010557 [Desmophyllum pertusum]|uniref:Uncharacterized protein n=1 Tax=Desmophyllum pertusum TaxID=174260 RepID=A0A9W9ZS53_9CNID|nr:hypothetical protein OS493_010557 [Desmophyllum pertusum]
MARKVTRIPWTLISVVDGGEQILRRRIQFNYVAPDGSNKFKLPLREESRERKQDREASNQKGRCFKELKRLKTGLYS